MPALATLAGKVVLLDQRSWPYLLLARFTADKAAPLDSPLGVDVGTLTCTQADGQFSVSGGRLQIPGQATPVSGDLGAVSPAYIRKPGRAFLCTFKRNGAASDLQMGWHNAGVPAAQNTRHAVFSVSGSQVDVRGASSIGALATLPDLTDTKLAIVLRPTGMGAWWIMDGVLIWPGANGSVSPLSAGFHSMSQVGEIDNLRVVDLPYPWNDPYGIAQVRLVNPPADTTPYAHASDFLLEFSFTYTAGQTAGMAFRTHTPGETSNVWRCYASSGGALVLDQVVATVPTNRISVGSTFSDTVAYRVVVIAEGNVYKVYVNDVLKGTYTDAGNFQTTETVGYVAFAGSPITEAIFWPRRVSLPNAA